MPTKLKLILLNRGWRQNDLFNAIKEKSGFTLGKDQISKIVSGVSKNYKIETAVMIAEALDVKVDDIIEIKNVRKKNA